VCARRRLRRSLEPIPDPRNSGADQSDNGNGVTPVSSSSAVAFSAHYKFSFKDTIVTGVLDSGSLRVETFNHFTDGSGRSDYYSRGYFCKVLRK
jgi:hypothetical protein